MDNQIALYIVLGGFYVLVLPGLVIFALVRIVRLNGEVEELRRAHRALLQRALVAVPPGEAAPVAAQTPLAVTQDVSLPPARVENKRLSLEQMVGGRALAWVGAAAVTLAGIFLVKYSIDQGWLDPIGRVLAAGLLGAIFVGAGELLRSRDRRIAQAASAAGVALLYVALFAAIAVYDFMSRGIGIPVAALLTIFSIGLSLRQGPFVALLALIGGALAPALIATRTGDPLTLFAYLLALIGGVMVVLRWQAARGLSWAWLGWCALATAALWAGLWLLLGYSADGMVWLGLFLLAIGALFVAVTYRVGGIGDDLQTALSWTALGLMSGLAALLIVRSDYQIFCWAVFLALGALVFFQARRFSDEWQWLGLTTPVLSLMVFWWWSEQGLLFDDYRRLALTALIVGGLISLGAYTLLWRAKQPVWWATLAAASAVLHFAVVYGALGHLGLNHVGWGMSWSLIALLLALAFALGAIPVARLRGQAGMDGALSALIVGAFAFVSMAVPIELRREWITMSYAVELPIVALIAWRLRLPLLRYVLWLLAATVTIRLVFNPYVLDYDVSASPILNWVLYGYGIAIL